jgi:hypothetical protein
MVELLRRIEANQERALQAQEAHLTLAREQLAQSSQRVGESLELQRVAIARQAQVRNIVLPLIFVLLGLLVYVLAKWNTAT